MEKKKDYCLVVITNIFFFFNIKHLCIGMDTEKRLTLIPR